MHVGGQDPSVCMLVASMHVGGQDPSVCILSQAHEG